MTNFNTIAQGYDNWYYTSKGKFLSDLEKQALVELIKPKPLEKLLDVGCGTGFFSFYFKSLGLDVAGLDISPKMLEVARAKGDQIKFIQGDAHNLPFPDNSFDIVTLITTLEFCKDPVKVLKEAYRVCKNRIVLGVLNKLSWLALERIFKTDSIYKKAVFYTPWGLKKLIKKSLSVENIILKIPFCAFMAVLICKE